MKQSDIRVQPEDFDFGKEYQNLRSRSGGAGALVFFAGLVRDFNAGGGLSGIVLEHYPAMTQKSLQRIAEDALRRWELAAITIIHRVGELHNHEQIVLVGVAARHRAEAFDAAQFIMDYLKTEAPFWKKEVLSSGETEWVDAKNSDHLARDRW
ncbi:molybdopterin synthase catalytic subunit MoaE [Ketobacter sp. MCCC 1A13808]|uniref:molybdopterin synthase catalytic subunit MoaE n=1 Tax=Ketobacter sp. MCCC 1A13808 TaxID=2602738 RepID=UPI000F108F60|nr:molybdopterin synthase catalytic subunit MoaE [Ketobacter sp. MCCC 1A13808]MVF10596.1 molybdopterin synthase catalytic subunit MoaE [Ketobacter sp. MCCC 1A13808]RLP56019.1 MAG: molybdopterin synthase catalytic subunit MoaE [Ketobacter sp.]